MKDDIADEKLLDFAKIKAIILKNFTVIARDKMRLMPLIMFPMIMIFIFGYTSGSIPKHIATAVVSYDDSAMSDEILSQISSSPVFSIRYRVSTEGEARNLLDEGKIRAFIILPPKIDEGIFSGEQQEITLVVDESDSAVASTAKQSLSAIVDSLSQSIGSRNLARYQEEVGTATTQLQAGGIQTNDYSLINSKIAAAEAAVDAAKKLSDDSLLVIKGSMPDATLYIPPNMKLKNYTVNTDYFYVNYPAGYSALLAQKALFIRTSALMDSASRNLQAASVLGSGASERIDMKESHEYLSYNVQKPLVMISLFVDHDTRALMKPLVYKEKPAYGTGKRAIDFTIASIIALTIFQGAIMGMGRAIAGEKREGSLTRVFLTPTSNATIIAGTLLFYIIFELIRSTFILLIAVSLFHITIEGSVLAIGIILAIFAGVSTSIGLIISSMVKTEQQFMAMAMLISMPSTFLSGAFFPLQAMPKVLQAIAQFLPITYAADALRGVMIKGFPLSMILFPLGVLIVILFISLSLVFMVFKRDIE